MLPLLALYNNAMRTRNLVSTSLCLEQNVMSDSQTLTGPWAWELPHPSLKESSFNRLNLFLPTSTLLEPVFPMRSKDI